MNPIRKVNFALRLLAQGQTREAAELSAQLLQESPEVAEVHALACELASVQERGQDALEHIERSLQLEPERHDFRLRKAGIQLVLRQGLAAQATAVELAALSPDDPDLQLAVARIFADCGNHAGAAKYLEAVAAEHRSSPEFLTRYATNQFFLGNIETAEQAVADYLALNPPRPGRKLLLRSAMRKQTSGRNHVDELRTYLAGSPPRDQAVNAHFALAKELEDLGDYQRSFEALRAGAALQRRSVRYNPADELANIRGIAKAFEAEAFEAIPDSGSTETPVFIVGLPRTGTTLVERLLTRSGDVKPSEENYDFTLAFSSVINEQIAAHPGRGLSPLSAALEADYGEIASRYLASMRGMLGEAASRAIGANSLLIRVGANFHDIGKMQKSEYYVENQNREFNKHDELSPSMSALVIAAHVKEGIELARKWRLPQAVIDFIPEHHGTMVMEYFYHKALNSEESSPVKVDDFRYPGPKPHCRETAILMLADAVEAATRSLAKPTPSRIREITKQIIDKRMLSGELDECNLTLADLAVAGNFTFAAACGLPMEEFPEIERWYAAISELDAWKATHPALAG